MAWHRPSPWDLVQGLSRESATPGRRWAWSTRPGLCRLRAEENVAFEGAMGGNRTRNF